MIVETVPIETLILDPNNARKHDAKNLEAIKGSIAKFKQQKPIVVGKNNVVVAGNGTLEAMRALGQKTIDIVRTDLTGNDAVAFALADNRTTDLSIWDDEILEKTLKSLYEENYSIGEIGFDADEFGFGDKDAVDYNKKIEIPIYEPTGEKPQLIELLNTDKTNKLVNRIDSSNLPREVKDFLYAAAYRHNVFNYEKIAEYYAHAPKDIQELMEESALVIIDFSKAIENGFVKLTNDIASLYKKSSPDDA